MWCGGWLRGDGNDGGRVFSLEWDAIAPIICSTQVIKRMIEYERRIIHANNLCENGNLSPQNAKMHVPFILNDKLRLGVNDNQAKKNYDGNCTHKYFDCAHFQCILKSTCVAITNLWCILIQPFIGRNILYGGYDKLWVKGRQTPARIKLINGFIRAENDCQSR